MRREEYLKRYDDRLVLEEPLFHVPLRKEYLLKEIGRGKRVLDLGCLGGQFSRLIQEQNNEVYGVEVNPRAAEAAQSRGIRVKVFDLNDGIPFEDEFFDVVNATDILEYIFDTKFLLEECSRVLKSNGTLLFTTPNLNSLSNRIRVLTGGYLGLMGAYPEDHFGEHIRIFNLSKLKELCEYTGFRVVDVRGVPTLTKNLLGYRVLRPLIRAMPQFGELLMVKAKRADET
ncbi:MAG: methyltransferase domain-containing protein [Bdellovibrionota bacterium]